MITFVGTSIITTTAVRQMPKIILLIPPKHLFVNNFMVESMDQLF